MPEPADEDIPPLGEPTPARRHRPRVGAAWYRRTPVVASGALLLGLVLGVALGSAVGGDDATEKGGTEGATDLAGPADGETRATTTEVRPSTTAVTLASACVETIRSAEQALGLLNQGLLSLRQLDVNDLDDVLDEMQQVRDRFRRRVEDCLEGQGIGPGTSVTTTPGAGE